MSKIHYFGDCNIREGGYFYTLNNWKWGYVDVMRVTPCNDWGAADNCYVLENLVVNLRTESNELASILAVCGFAVADLPKGVESKHMQVEAHVGYGAYDRIGMQVVQIGAKQREYGEPVQVNHVLRGNASLRKYARQLFKEVL